jgi:hypothetical protein
MDWKTPIGEVSLKIHWRLRTAWILCAVFSIGLLWWRLPDVMPIQLFWVAGVSGGFVGSILGGCWEIETSQDRVVSGKLIVTSILAYGVFSLFGIFGLLPDMQNDQRMIDRFRSMADCRQVVVTSTAGEDRVIDEPDQLDEIRKAAQQGRLFYLSHEATTPVGQVVFQLQDLHQLRFEIVRSTRQGRLLLQFPGIVTEPHYLSLGKGDERFWPLLML